MIFTGWILIKPFKWRRITINDIFDIFPYEQILFLWIHIYFHVNTFPFYEHAFIIPSPTINLQLPLYTLIDFDSMFTIVPLLCFTMALCTILYLNNGWGYQFFLIEHILYMRHFLWPERLEILCSIFKIRAFFITVLLTQLYERVDISITWGKHLLESLSASFHKELSLGLIEPTTFYWSACVKPGKWKVAYICVRSNDFVNFSTIFSSRVWVPDFPIFIGFDIYLYLPDEYSLHLSDEGT